LKALIFTQPYCFEYADFPDPSIGDDNILVRVKACGICGSDVQGATGKTGRRIPPLIMGHEAAGIVEGAGKHVKGFKRGDRVCFDSTVYCNQCEPCRAGQFNRCIKREVLGVSTSTFKRHGAFAEYVALPWWIVAPIPDNMSFLHAALLEPVSIALHAANRGGDLKNKTVVVIGAGTIGLFIVQAARLKGAARVAASDINEFRLETAKTLGADAVVNPDKSALRETITKEVSANGADVSFEAVGYARTFQDALSVTRTGGHVVLIGNVQKMVELDVQDFVARELTATGSYASAGEFRDCVGLVATGQINVQPLISDVMPLNQGARAFERLLRGSENLLKIVLEP